MDMRQYNADIMNAEDNVAPEDKPRYPDGDYVLSVSEHEEKKAEPVPGTEDYKQRGIWVTFRICEGQFAGKDYKEYFGLKHPHSTIHVKYGLAGLKRIYTALGGQPNNFAETYGRRFIGTLKSKKSTDKEWPWNTEIVKTANYVEQAMGGLPDRAAATGVTPNSNVADTGGLPPIGETPAQNNPAANAGGHPADNKANWNGPKDDIDNIPF